MLMKDKFHLKKFDEWYNQVKFGSGALTNLDRWKFDIS